MSYQAFWPMSYDGVVSYGLVRMDCVTQDDFAAGIFGFVVRGLGFRVQVLEFVGSGLDGWVLGFGFEV